MAETRLRRSVSLPWLTCYGLGIILGARIYVLVGKIAGVAGPVAFLLSALLVFILVNLALWRIQRREPAPVGVHTMPWIIPRAGFIISALFFGYSLWMAQTG